MKKFVLIVFLPALLFGQGIFIKEGTHSVTASYSHLTNETSSANGFGLVGSISGIFDFGFAYSVSKADEVDVKATSFTPSVSFTFRRDNKLGGARLSLGVLTSEISSSSSSKTFDISGLIVGATVAMPLVENESVALLPTFGVTYGFLSATGEESETSRNLGLELLMKIKANEAAVVLGPGLSINLDGGDNAFSYGLGFAILFNFGTQ